MVETAILILILVFSVVLHEVAHGWVADLCGDSTAKQMGRLTLNPIPHLDLFGSIIIPVFLVLSHSGLFIGWAKPVPVVPSNFRNYRRDNILVSLAGPSANFLIALVASIFIIFQLHSGWNPLAPLPHLHAKTLYTILNQALTMNVFLAVFNLLPFPPLDGSHVILSLLPDKYVHYYNKIGFAGIFVLLFMFNVPQVKVVFYTLVIWCIAPFHSLIKLFL